MLATGIPMHLQQKPEQSSSIHNLMGIVFSRWENDDEKTTPKTTPPSPLRVRTIHHPIPADVATKAQGTRIFQRNAQPK